MENPRPGKKGLDGVPVLKQGTHVFQRVAVLIAVASFLVTLAGAQVLKRPHDDQPTPDQNQSKVNSKSPKKYPRAIGVLEFLPGGATRLVPVALWIDDRFYDASLYAANPVPMAVEPETVYEATNYGERLGLFTISNAQEFKGTWVAAGKWKPRAALDEKLAADAARQPKPKPKTTDMDDERPTLKRSGESGPSSGASSGSARSSAGSAGASGGGNSGAGPSSSGRASSAGTPSTAEDDPNRPTLKKPAPATPPPTSQSASSTQTASASSVSSSAVSPDENDPNRPMLRRGKPTQSSTASTAAFADLEETKPSAAKGKGSTNAMTITRSYPAVSYAGPFETRSLLYAMNDSEHASKTEQMSALALDEIRKFIAQRHSPALPKEAAITSPDLRSYDLDYHNNPTLVFTAALPVAGVKAFGGGDFSYFVTIVAHEDYNGLPVKIFSSVSDSNHLDAFPRMEIIDAVDADANGRGDLLFRQFSDTGISYSLYRVFPYDMQKIFEGGSGV